MNPNFLKEIRTRDPHAPVPFHLRCTDPEIGFLFLPMMMRAVGDSFHRFIAERGHNYRIIDVSVPEAQQLLIELEYRGFHRCGEDPVVRVIGSAEIDWLMRTYHIAACCPCKKVAMMMPHGGLVRSPDNDDLESAFVINRLPNYDHLATPLRLPDDYESEGSDQTGDSDNSSDIVETEPSSGPGKGGEVKNGRASQRECVRLRV